MGEMARITTGTTPQRRVIRRPPRRKVRRLSPLAYCDICGEPIYTDSGAELPGSLCFDHTWPKERYPQFRNKVWNLQPAHKLCNERKGDRDPTPEEARRALARREPTPAPRLIAKRRRPPASRRVTPAVEPGSLVAVLKGL
jgi:5-methylcytosine-specific restriction endonuclease McrA